MSPQGITERQWVEIGFVVLSPSERTGHLPDDTRAVPYYVRVKGFVEGNPRVGETVTIETLLGRKVEGEVLQINPEYGHSFGRPSQELIEAGCEARNLIASLEAEL